MDSLSIANIIDLACVAVLIAGAIAGMIRGLSGELAQLCGSVAALVFGLWAFNPLSAWLLERPELRDEPDAARVLTLLALLLAASAILIFLQFGLQRLFKVAVPAGADKVLGLAAGLAKWAVIIVIVFLVMNLWPNDALNSLFGEKSLIGRQVAGLMPMIEEEAESRGGQEHLGDMLRTMRE